ncbi:MAG: Do family serine endopeptidase [Planctomycetaceae bacterium]|nr:Do family serine endopeptidase [Planctomycetaceae bacterium]
MTTSTMPMKTNTARYFALGAVVALLAAAGIYYLGHRDGSESFSPTINHKLGGGVLPAPAFAQTGSKDGSNLADIAARVMPSVVNISSTRVVKTAEGTHPSFDDPFFRDFFGRRSIPRERTERSLGSGVIIAKEGVVVTNHHVVAQASDIVVGLHDGREFKADIAGSDEKSDLAVLRLLSPDDKEIEKLSAIALGDSSRMRIGDVVLALGNPFGVGQTVTMGIISATGRASVGINEYEDFIQTDAAINPGNSGGALVNMEGDLIGINSAIISRSGGYQGIGFAIPSNMAKGIVDNLLRNGRVVRGWLGVSVQDITADLAESMNMPDTKGVLVSDVTAESPASKAGIMRGDVILTANNEDIKSSAQLRNAVASLGPGTKITLKVRRESSVTTKELVLAELPEVTGAELTIGGDQGVLGGMTITDLNDTSREKYEIPEGVKNGVIVTNVEPGSSAARGVQAKDVIVEVNRESVGSVGDFQKLYNAKERRVLLLINRDGGTYYVTLSR